MRRRLAEAVAAAVLAFAAAHPAQGEATGGGSSPSPFQEASYGIQILGLDALALTAIAVSLSNSDRGYAKPLLWSGGTLLAVGSPLVHLAHGAPREAGLALLFRAGPPLLGLALYALPVKMNECSQEEREPCVRMIWPALGLLGGAVGMVIDWTQLSTEPVPRVSVALSGGSRRGVLVAVRF